MEITNQNLMDNEVTHWRMGNGYAVVQILPDEYCRVVQIGKGQIDKQALLCCTRPTLIKLEKPLEPEIKALLQPILDGLASGKLKVVNTRWVEA